MPPPLSVGVVADFLEERWPSMELVAELTVRALAARPDRFLPELLRPPMPRVFRRLAGERGWNGDRALGRYAVYPAWLRGRRGLDRYHVTDHSYAHLVHVLPARRTLVTCHDLDAFTSLLDPAGEPRPAWFRAIARRVLSGLAAAGHVVTDSETVRSELLERGIVTEGRVSTVQLPAHPDFGPDADPGADRRVEELLRGPPAGPELLHVGSTAARKRIPLLLEAVAELADDRPGLRLLRVGGALDAGQRALARRLGVEGRVVELPPLPRRLLAAVYRRCALVALPSEREGFGLPLVEAMACGSPVLVSDLPVLREVGGDAAGYVSAGGSWSAAIAAALRRLEHAETRADARARGLAHAARFSLEAYGAGLGVALDRLGSA